MGTPLATLARTIHPVFDDPYSRGGLAEKDHTFVQAQGLGARFSKAELVVGELGFGQGLTFLATVRAARAAGGILRFVSFEQYPLAWGEVVNVWRGELGEEKMGWEAFLEGVAGWGEVVPGRNVYTFAGGVLELWAGDARALLPQVEMMADAWFLDGHAPVKNPGLWEEGLLREVSLRTKAGGTVSTYSCAGVVLEGLAAAGFAVAKVKGFGVKRRMTVGWKT